MYWFPLSSTTVPCQVFFLLKMQYTHIKYRLVQKYYISEWSTRKLSVSLIIGLVAVDAICFAWLVSIRTHLIEIIHRKVTHKILYGCFCLVYLARCDCNKDRNIFMFAFTSWHSNYYLDITRQGCSFIYGIDTKYYILQIIDNNFIVDIKSVILVICRVNKTFIYFLFVIIFMTIFHYSKTQIYCRRKLKYKHKPNLNNSKYA